MIWFILNLFTNFTFKFLLGAQTTIIQNLQYYEHLSEPMAEFLNVLVQQYDHTQLVESTLMYVNY